MNNEGLPPFKAPDDGEEVLEIGELNFEFVEDKCSMQLVPFGNAIDVLLTIKTGQIKQAIDTQLLEHENGSESGVITLHINGLQILNEDYVGTGEFSTEKSSVTYRQNLFFNIEGGRPLKFHGRIAEDNRWLSLNGTLISTTNENHQWAINICKYLEKGKFEWNHHTFTLDEARNFPADYVHTLEIRDYKESEFPVEIFRYKDLEKLELASSGALKVIPDEIEILKRLDTLSISGSSIEHLPNSLFNLPALRILSLFNNKLKCIPENINLPCLESAAFNKNQLTTLPKSLALQPKLRRLSLPYNPLESLPAEFDSVESLDLSLAEKLRFLEHRYKGADGSGTIQWDNKPFFVNSDPELQNTMLEAIKNTVWEPHKDTVIDQALKAVCINPTEIDDYSRLGNTRFGGMPDMPIGETYPMFPNIYQPDNPHHYIFYAQLNLEELAPLQSYLPRNGMLYFYVKEETEFTCRVLYYPNKQSLQSAKTLANITLNYTDSVKPYKPKNVECRPLAALPAVINGQSAYEFENEYDGYDKLNTVERAEYDNNTRRTLPEKLGRIGIYSEYTDVYYSDMNHTINDSTNGVTDNSPNERAAVELKGNPEDWVVLLRMYSDLDSGFQFYDAGELYFMIHKSDLAKADFSNVFAIADSS